MQPSSPALPPLPHQKRLSLKPSTSQILAASPSYSEDVIRAHDVEETDIEIQEREDSDAMNEIIMAIDMKDRGTVGCAYYVAREEKLCMMEDMKMAGLDLVDLLKLHAQPTIVLISTRSDERLEEHLNKEARGIDRGEEASRSPCSLLCTWLTNRELDDVFGSYILDSRPSSEFSYEAARNKLTKLELNAGEAPNIRIANPGDGFAGDAYTQYGGVGRQGRLVRLAGCVDVDSKLTV
jgi:DNA mismatch repair protein MSH5